MPEAGFPPAEAAVRGTAVAWIGIGKMGLPMVTHLIRAGCRVVGFDPAPRNLDELVARGGGSAPSARLAARGAQVVFTSVPDDEAFSNAATGPEGVIAGCEPGALFVDTSTVSPEASARVAKIAQAHDVRYLRTTVSGNNHFAQEARLTVMASGARADYEQALPLLRLFGPSQFYLGEEEQARMIKLVINLMVAGTSALLAEALSLGRRGGIDWKLMLDVLCASAVASPIVVGKSQQLKERDFSPTFTARQMGKDLRLILKAGEALDVPLPLAALVTQGNQAVLAAGEGGEDYIAVVKQAERLAGLAQPQGSQAFMEHQHGHK
ncbi:MAG TPA: NAD(P)-dependent oxidoreductase [Ramlibacter sp.]|nr:NAD(P)-dependent oxidoreductase [Ramlibacter sp.]